MKNKFLCSGSFPDDQFRLQYDMADDIFLMSCRSTDHDLSPESGELIDGRGDRSQAFMQIAILLFRLPLNIENNLPK